MFGYKGTDSVILEIPTERAHYAISSSTILTFFQDHNISIIDSSEGVVTFKRDCALMGKAEILSEAFVKKFHELAPTILIEEKPYVFVKTSLPEDFERYELLFIDIPNTMLRKNSGSFFAQFRTGNQEKKLYFFYEMKAKALVFKAKHNLHNGKILNNDDYESIWLNLDAIPLRALIQELPRSAVVKGSLKAGQILADYHLSSKKLFSKQDRIKALFKEEGLIIEIEATVLSDADIGDVVKIKTEHGKVLNAKIISSKEAIILK
ncbi:flagellar basal body P-ring formation chaperone FlgA [Sulfurospirillum barnesii]|uniref:Flagella basal body P-ring formation protein FlgA n=1 Tax=Sulfurospirillum barnesii (strain ATCC 700032 / DSM 10660 / SES-3) TaxID=760154 RepID=I3XXD8_SULBS|nr:flagellar basal body P-ring formation chaperone FlgA [Sulfurospirillum barnesii]AFL68612.1 flagella basal body P-ring formation protein FlgA [Sulfurospirillum barnesii SES-3]